MKEITLERNLLCLKHVGSFSPMILKGMKEFTQKTGLMHVRIVKKPSAALVIVPDMKCFTLAGSLMLLVSTVDNLHYFYFAQE